MSKRSDKTSASLGAVGVIIFAVYCLFVFLVFKIQNPGIFLMSFAFMCMAFIAQAVAPAYIMRNLSPDTAFFGIPVAQLAVFYFFSELFASLVFMTFQSFVSWKAALLVQVVVLAIFAVAAIIAITTQSSVREMSEDRRNEAVAFKAQFVDIQTLIDRFGGLDPELKKLLEHLAETVRYSDPFGRNEPIIQDVEARVFQKLNELESACAAGATGQAAGLIGELENLYMERRRKLMLVK